MKGRVGGGGKLVDSAHVDFKRQTLWLLRNYLGTICYGRLMLTGFDVTMATKFLPMFTKFDVTTATRQQVFQKIEYSKIKCDVTF